MIITTDRPITFKKQYEKTMNELYHLEDINNYRNNSIGKAIDILQKIKIKKVI